MAVLPGCRCVPGQHSPTQCKNAKTPDKEAALTPGTHHARSSEWPLRLALDHVVVARSTLGRQLQKVLAEITAWRGVVLKRSRALAS